MFYDLLGLKYYFRILLDLQAADEIHSVQLMNIISLVMQKFYHYVYTN